MPKQTKEQLSLENALLRLSNSALLYANKRLRKLNCGQRITIKNLRKR